jgi:hypothetical protein
VPLKLPPGIDQRTFDAAIRKFRSVVGDEWVFTTEDDVDTYRDPYSMRWGHEDEYLASAAVAPNEVEQVQAIVRVANEYRIPVYPISTGKNLTYGGAAPAYSGSVVVDLKRMNRILRVDDKRNFALVEPGVSYFDLYRYIQENGLKVWIDCADPGWGGLMGNSLDHGIGYTAANFRDHFGAHCGMEVVLPTGEVMRTGMGALPGADTWQDYRYGVGPWVDGLFAQANFGIVTKMGFWLFPEPEACMIGDVLAPKYSDFGSLVEHINYLEDAQLATGRPVYSSPLGLALPNDELQSLLAPGWPSTERLDSLAAQKRIPAWRVRLKMYGPAQTLRGTWAYVQQRIGRAIPGATFENDQLVEMPLKPDQYPAHHLVDFGIPNMQVFSSIARRPDDPPNMADGHSDFFAIVPRTAEGCFRALETIYNVQRKLGVSPITASPFRGPTGWYHRAFFIGAPTLPNYRDDPAKNWESRKLFAAYLSAVLEQGFSPYRTNPGFHDQLAQAYSFNSNVLLRFQERLKDAADPNGVIAPGRYGIWPKRLRGAKA